MRTKIRILFENDDVVAVDKPVDVSCIPERDPKTESLLRWLEDMFGRRLFVVHRLDKDVSGVMIYAKTSEAHRCLNMQFDRHEVQKHYIALVHGIVERDNGTICFPLRECGSGRVAVDVRDGKPSITRYSVKERNRCMTLVEVSPVTGRRHQIRVHFYNIGHPIVGDRRYGDKRLQATYPRLMLHAARIEFTLLDGRRYVIVSSLSDEVAVLARAIAQNLSNGL